MSTENRKIPLISFRALAIAPEDSYTKWLVDRLIPKGAVVSLSCLPGSFKSWFALILCYCIATGKPFLGRSVAKGRAAYIDKENPKSVLIERIKEIGKTRRVKIWPNWTNPEPPLLVDGRYDKLTLNRDLLVFDSLRRFHHENENVPHEMALVF